MGLSYKGSINFANSFNSTLTRPLDVRLVVDSIDDLTNGSIEAPYVGMVVAIKYTSAIYIYTGRYITYDEDGNEVEHKGIEGAGYIQNWSRILSVEVIDEMTQECINDLINPEEGLLVNVRNTDKLYILVKPDNWETEINWNYELSNYLRIGGIVEEHAYQVMTPDQRDEAVNCVHNRFKGYDPERGKDDEKGDFYILLDPNKSRDGFGDEKWPHVEMVTTEMMDDLEDQLNERIDNLDKTLTDKIDGVEINLQNQLDSTRNDLENDINNIDENVQDETERLDTKIDDINNTLTDSLNEISSQTNERIQEVESDLRREIEDVDEHYDEITNDIESKIDRNFNTVNDNINEVDERTNQRINKIEDDLHKEIDDVDQYHSNENDRIDETIENTRINLDDKIDEVDNRTNRRIDEVNNDLTNQIIDVDSYYDKRTDDIEDEIQNVQNDLENKIDTGDEHLGRRIDEIQKTVENTFDDIDEHISSETDRLENKIDNVDSTLNNKIDNVNDDVNQRIDLEIDTVEGHIEDLRQDLLGPDFDDRVDTFREVAEWVAKHTKEYNILKSIAEMVGREHHDQIMALKKHCEEQDAIIDRLRAEMDEMHRKIKDGEILTIYTHDDCCNITHYALSCIKDVQFVPDITNNETFRIKFIDNSKQTHQHLPSTLHLSMDVIDVDDYSGELTIDKNTNDNPGHSLGILNMSYLPENSKCSGMWIDLVNHKLIIDKIDDHKYDEAPDYEYTPDDSWFPIYGHVDLGLPSRTLWASHNLGAYEPEEVGFYFQFGCVDGYYPYEVGGVDIGKVKEFNSDSYPFNDEWTSQNKFTDLNDAAKQLCGHGWRMPSKNDFDELIDYTTITSVENYNETGVAGILITSRINGKTLFIPYGGYYNGSNCESIDKLILLWTSNVYNNNDAISFYYNKSGSYGTNNYSTYFGCNIRAVKIADEDE